VRALAWRLWELQTRRPATRFRKALGHPEAAQQDVLSSILKNLRGTAYAKAHGFKGDETVSEYRKRMPIMTAADLEGWTARILKGEGSILTSEVVERLVPTSGSTGPAKLIPMTPSSRREYACAVNLWMHTFFQEYPEIKKGTAYIATSPAIHYPNPGGTVPVGYAEDQAYLGPLEKRILNQLLAVPTQVADLREAQWREAVCKRLLQAKDLRLISLWHPSYLQAIFSEASMSDLREVWPKLRVISTWSDGVCAGDAKELMGHFPGVGHQRKGLWLTEGVISIPWQKKTPLALLNGFLEFEDGQGSCSQAHELEVGQVYRPILSNHAGLYRYRLGDAVRVTGFMDKTPCIEWLGRGDAVSDMRGEKLSEAQVQQAFASLGIQDPILLKPDPSRQPPCYLVLCDRESLDVEKIDQLLRQNPHYDWARQLGQLGPLRQCPYQRPERKAGEKASFLINSPSPVAPDPICPQ
jgi:hypothetical protein